MVDPRATTTTTVISTPSSFSAAHTSRGSPLDALDDYAPVQTDDTQAALDPPSMRSPNATRPGCWSSR